MTEENEELLLKDLCARLPYHPLIKIYNDSWEGCRVGEYDNNLSYLHVEAFLCDRIEILPYLRSFSSMTKEEKEQLEELTYNEHEDFVTTTGRRMILATDSDTGYGSAYFSENISEVVEWLNKHHFDYRELIKKGLALEAPANMYNIKS